MTMTMTGHFAGLDVSLEATSICVVDGQGGIVFEGSVATDPDAVAAALASHAPGCVGLEAGPMSEWLHTGLTHHGLQTVLMETRQVRAALKASLVKTDRRDARGIAQLLRMGWFRPVHVKTACARERRVLLGAATLWSVAPAISTMQSAVCCAASGSARRASCVSVGAIRSAN